MKKGKKERPESARHLPPPLPSASKGSPCPCKPAAAQEAPEQRCSHCWLRAAACPQTSYEAATRDGTERGVCGSVRQQRSPEAARAGLKQGEVLRPTTSTSIQHQEGAGRGPRWRIPWERARARAGRGAREPAVCWGVLEINHRNKRPGHTQVPLLDHLPCVCGAGESFFFSFLFFLLETPCFLSIIFNQERMENKSFFFLILRKDTSYGLFIPITEQNPGDLRKRSDLQDGSGVR